MAARAAAGAAAREPGKTFSSPLAGRRFGSVPVTLADRDGAAAGRDAAAGSGGFRGAGERLGGKGVRPGNAAAARAARLAARLAALRNAGKAGQGGQGGQAAGKGGQGGAVAPGPKTARSPRAGRGFGSVPVTLADRDGAAAGRDAAAGSGFRGAGERLGGKGVRRGKVAAARAARLAALRRAGPEAAGDGRPGSQAGKGAGEGGAAAPGPQDGPVAAGGPQVRFGAGDPG